MQTLKRLNTLASKLGTEPDALLELMLSQAEASFSLVSNISNADNKESQSKRRKRWSEGSRRYQSIRMKEVWADKKAAQRQDKRKLSDEHKAALANGLKAYWERVAQSKEQLAA